MLLGQAGDVDEDREHTAEQQAKAGGVGATYADSQARISPAGTAHTPSH